ncbi:MAG: diguanylate cyclase [Candidatus Eisenbacteria bacterium]|uniref:Diguanylate cyclase n=1 Tax=Eiseniibacteriota bacterium TaxID=2212470 RepID=A0A956NEH1_UNCEI|nr:diguanylate cyclase [Candidatus Eisenbacteria bacterium]
MGRATTKDLGALGEEAGTIRLLMVEDSEDDYLLARGFLESAYAGKYDIDWAPTFDEGLQKLGAGRYDLCVLDYRLGDRTGLQLLASAREKGVDLPFVMLTNETDSELDGRALQLGAADFLSKLRIDPELLHRSIRFAVHHHRMISDLRARQERVSKAALAARDGIWEWLGEEDAVLLSEQWAQWLPDANISPEPTPTQVWLDSIHPDDRSTFETKLSDHLEGREETFQLEYRMRSREGGWRWMHVRGLALTRGEQRLTGFQSDITDRKLVELRLERDAHHDPLTGLANRKVFLQKVNAVLSRPGMARKCAILYIDLDDFKMINEEHGHLAGDRVLVEVARRIEDSLRCNDTASRMGGDEFVALLEGVGSEEEARHVVRRMATAFQAPVRLDHGSVRVTASFGIALGSASFVRPQEWLREADAALFDAKREGKAQGAIRGATLTLLPPPSTPVRVERTQTSFQKERSLDLDERVTVQPIVSLVSGRMEAIRLRIDPIEVQEEIAAVWRGVNVRHERWVRLGWMSPTTPFLVSSFASGPALALSIPPELGKSFIVEQTYRPEGVRRMAQKSERRHAVSGFPLEYSALRSLVRNQPEVVLVDVRSVLDCREEDWELFRVFLHMAEDLRAKVVAEGVGSAADREGIKQAGVHFATGPLLAPWMSLELFSAWLRPGRAA